ncbi:MAG: sialidase family protein [bacterium]
MKQKIMEIIGYIFNGFSIVLLILIFAGFCTNENTPKIPSGVITYSKLFTDEMSTEVSCYRIPALITASDGTLIAAVDERVESCTDLRTNKNINNEIVFVQFSLQWLTRDEDRIEKEENE